MIKTNLHQRRFLPKNAYKKLRQEDRDILAIFTKGWFVEGFFYITFVAFIWTNEEPSKLNTILAAWSAYAIVAFALFQGIKSGTITNPRRWVRVYFIQSLLLLFVCDYIWMHKSVVRTIAAYYDPIRVDAYAVILADSGMDPEAVTFQSRTGMIWYAGFIYWIFGVSKFYVTLFNGALSFVVWVLFASIMRRTEGNPQRWQWLCLGMLLPDFIIHFANVSKEPLCAFLLALGSWVIIKCRDEKLVLPKLVLFLIPVIAVGFVVRTATAVLIITFAIIWFWNIQSRIVKIEAIIALCVIVIYGQPMSDYLSKRTRSSEMSWSRSVEILVNPNTRVRSSMDYYEPGSWNMITESLPMYLMPIIAPVKGFFMMIAPMPLWKLPIFQIWDDIGFCKTESWGYYEEIFRKGTAWLFLLSMPLLLSASIDAYRYNRRMWLLTSFTFIVFVCVMGFAVSGAIEARYRPMILPFWLSMCGIGYYYGRPKRYILPCIFIVVIGFSVYVIPKVI